LVTLARHIAEAVPTFSDRPKNPAVAGLMAISVRFIAAVREPGCFYQGDEKRKTVRY
jgi:hypothetical protein